MIMRQSPGMTSPCQDPTTPVPGSFHVVDPQEGSIAPDSPASSRDVQKDIYESGVRLIAVRHGQSEANAMAENKGTPILCGQVESPLSMKGKTQAAEAAAKIYQELGGDTWMIQAACNPALIPVLYTSNLSRAEETARATVDLLKQKAGELAGKNQITPGEAGILSRNLEPHVDKRITEMNYGDYELRPVTEVFKEKPEFMENWESYRGKGVDFIHPFPHGESRSNVIDRVGSFMQDVASHDRGRTIIMFCHLETIVAAQTILGKTQIDNGRLWVNAAGIKNATPIALTE